MGPLYRKTDPKIETVGMCVYGTLCRGEMFVIRLVVYERTTYKKTPIAKPAPALPIIDLTKHSKQLPGNTNP